MRPRDDGGAVTEAKVVIVELRLALGQALKARRTRLQLSQQALADRIRSSQSRVAKMESADPAVSFELLLRGLIATGASRHDVATVVAGRRVRRTPRPGRG